MTSRHIAHLPGFPLASAGEGEAGQAALAAREARAALLGVTAPELDARYRRILAGPPATREAQSKVAALFGLVVAPEPDAGAGRAAS